MKTFFSDIIPKLARFSQKLDNLTLLTNQHWVVIDEIQNSKYVYIFRSNNDLLVSIDGRVEKGKWEHLGNNSLLIERKNETYLFRHGFFDENILALKVDGKDEYAFLVNENRFEGEINSISKVFEFLQSKYLAESIVNQTKKEITSQKSEITEINYSDEELQYAEAIKKVNPIIRSSYNEISITYLDGRKGRIFFSHTYKRFYVDFKERRVFYNTKEDAIVALRHYIIHKRITEKGRFFY
jgi:hypothetical protein